MKLCEPCTINYTYSAFLSNMIHKVFMILNVPGAGAVVNFPQTKVIVQSINHFLLHR